MCYGHDRGTVINVPASYFSQSMQTKRYLLNGQTYIIVDRVTTDRTVRPFSQFKQVFFGLFTFTITELGKTNSISRNLEANLINTSLKIRLHEAIRFLVFYQWNLMGLFFFALLEWKAYIAWTHCYMRWKALSETNVFLTWYVLFKPAAFYKIQIILLVKERCWNALV